MDEDTTLKAEAAPTAKPARKEFNAHEYNPDDGDYKVRPMPLSMYGSINQIEGRAKQALSADRISKEKGEDMATPRHMFTPERQMWMDLYSNYTSCGIDLWIRMQVGKCALRPDFTKQELLRYLLEHRRLSREGMKEVERLMLVNEPTQEASEDRAVAAHAREARKKQLEVRDAKIVSAWKKAMRNKPKSYRTQAARDVGNKLKPKALSADAVIAVLKKAMVW
ncbi:MAG TPA: hypothetical protein P5318_19330 [Candidatus Hydrogenedentes bacterium]|nr:hypothetical protein [Candidatus Hydrogenedentota bacterium]